MGPFSNASKPMSFEVGLCIMPSSSSVKCGVLGGCVRGYVAVAAKKSVSVKSAVKTSGKKDQHFFSASCAL
jgi:hypothetical protein